MKRTGPPDSMDTMVSPKTPKIREKRGFWAQGPPWALGPYDSPYSPFVGCRCDDPSAVIRARGPGPWGPKGPLGHPWAPLWDAAVMASAVMASAAPPTPSIELGRY